MKWLSLFFGLFASPIWASGWNDYHLEIAPGFTIYRANTFEICLGKNDRIILFCPERSGTFGPIKAYVVTDTTIITRHSGVRPSEGNPSIPEEDPNKEYFFLTLRASAEFSGPFTREEWSRKGLPELRAVTWVEPQNPHFWRSRLGNLMFVGYMLWLVAWPILLAATVAVIAWRFYRRRKRNARTLA